MNLLSHMTVLWFGDMDYASIQFIPLQIYLPVEYGYDAASLGIAISHTPS